VSLQNKLIFIVMLTLVFISMVFVKVVIEARSEHQQAEKAFQAHDLDAAITHYNRAIHWYSPGNPHVAKSIDRLWQIGQTAEQQGDHSLALRAYQGLRSSLYSARSFYTPHPDWIDKCDNRIADLFPQQKAASPEMQVTAKTPSREEVLTNLKTQTGADYLWSIICEAGFVGWIACVFGFIIFVFTGEKGFQTKGAFVWGAMIVFFYAVWIIGMLKA